MNANSDKVIEIFCEAARTPNLAARTNYLDSTCGQDTELRHQVDSLLDAHSQAGDFLDQPILLSAPTRGITQTGDQVGRYTVLELIGEGGFGTVFIAQQNEPVQREVALKIIKAGMDTRQVIARFEAERQALAMMDHPHIARILDGGTTDQGRPFFVMELVNGIPITRFCDENQLDLPERLRLFMGVCEAVQHAHQKGIIHRDLKATNILITQHQGQTTPKVIDFGIAKAMDGSLTDKTLVTVSHQLMGTPQYMSPEQAGQGQGDIDTRSDIFSLGVLLYELLTGKPPLAIENQESADYDDIRRKIREEEPEPPSSRNRKQSRTVSPRDLDWITLKALEKDRNRRYPSVEALQADIRRFLESQPVEAAAPSPIYRLGKFVNRNKTSVVAALLVLTTLVSATLISTWMALRAMDSAANAEAALKFVREDLLGQANPYESDPDRPPDRDIKLLTAIQQAAVGLDERYSDRPLVLADIHYTLGQAYQTLDELDDAEKHLTAGLKIFQEELGPDAIKTLETANAFAWVRLDQSNYKAAETISLDILAYLESHSDPPLQLHLRTWLCLGWSLMRMGRYEGAEEALDRVMELSQYVVPTDHGLIVGTMFGLAGTKFYSKGYHEESNNLLQDTYEYATRHLGADHPKTLLAAIEMVNILRNSKRDYHRSYDLAKETLERCLRVLGEDHNATLFLRSELAGLSATRGLNYISLQRTVMKAMASSQGEDHTKTLFEQLRLGNGLFYAGYFTEGEALLKDARERLLSLKGPENNFSRWALNGLTRMYDAQGKFEASEALRRTGIDVLKKSMGPDSPQVANHLKHLGHHYARQGKWEDATKAFQESLECRSTNLTVFRLAILSSWLANDPRTTRQVITQSIQSIDQVQDANLALEISQTLLLLQGHLSALEREQVLKLAQTGLGFEDDPAGKQLLEGLMAWSRHDWASVDQHLAPMARELPSPFNCLAGFLLAHSYQVQGREREAQMSWDRASEAFLNAVKPGDLVRSGSRIGPDWIPYAMSLVARLETARIMPGSALTAIDTSYLQEARRQWLPVRELIQKADWAARYQRWEEAATLFSQVVSQPAFAWEAIRLQEPDLNNELAMVSLMNGDEQEYMHQVKHLVFPSETEPFGDAMFALCRPVVQSPEYLETARTLAQRDRDKIARNQAPKSALRRADLVMGMAEYRSGNHESALESLANARQAFALSISGCANAYTAMALLDLNKVPEAEQTLEEANRILDELRQGNPDHLRRNWAEAALLILSVQEARQVMAQRATSQSP